tara:strand:- start:3506 stop:4861 length:1356 start_codon:yes stop_codon:yes gene_type:complete
MASSYSSDLKLELMVTGENAGTWGDKTNTNLNLVQQAIAGFEQVTLSSGGTVALVMSDGALSNARNLVIKFATITAGSSTVCTVPDSIEKFYIFDCRLVTNPTNLTIKTASGTGFSPDAQKIYAAYTDGTNLTEISLDTLGGTIGTAQVADDAITNDKIADDAIRAAQLSNNAVITATINDDAVTQAKIADDAVGADQLINTTVSAGTYTAATITVDAQGRLTAASSGSAGTLNMRPTFMEFGPNSGTYTAQPTASTIYAYVRGGGGGGGGARQNGPTGGGKGGVGGFGFFSIPISQPYAVPYSIGAGGTGSQTIPNSAPAAPSGGATTLNTNDAVANGGTGGNTGNPGNGTPGTAPGAEKAFTDGTAAPNSDLDMGYGSFPFGTRFKSTTYNPFSTGGASQTVPLRENDFMTISGHGGGPGVRGGNPSVGGPTAGGDGASGSIVIFENIG